MSNFRFSGITAGIKLKKELGLTTFTIFDENEDVGGTWLVNTYPGCACDVQSHLYSLSFELNPSKRTIRGNPSGDSNVQYRCYGLLVCICILINKLVLNHMLRVRK